MQLCSTVTDQQIVAGTSTLNVRVHDTSVTVDDFVNCNIRQSDLLNQEDAFYVINLGDVINKYRLWKEKLPRVEPFYAVKCNDDIGVLQTLATLGTGFDCASKYEIGRVKSLSVAPERIIYAHPCKTSSHIVYARDEQVQMTTFDNEPELHKMARLHPTAQLVVRIRADDPTAQCNLGIKFGATVTEAKRLLTVAQRLQLNVIGVSFHVGSGCTNADAYTKAIGYARDVFDYAATLGMSLSMLDLGGGYPGHKGAGITFDEICDTINPALDKHFPVESGVRVIAEPGRFFVASAFTLAVSIIAKRDVPLEQLVDEDTPRTMYYVNDGVYGSFNCLMYDHASVEVKVPPFYRPTELHRSSIWGPTCDGIDCISKATWLPEMDVGQWLIFEDMGAYTCAASSTFNGFPRPYMLYVVPEAEYTMICDQLQKPTLRRVPTDEGVSMEDVLREMASQEEDLAMMSCAVQGDCYEIPMIPEIPLFTE